MLQVRRDTSSSPPTFFRHLNEVVTSAVGSAKCHKYPTGRTSSSANQISVMRLMGLSTDDEACTP